MICKTLTQSGFQKAIDMLKKKEIHAIEHMNKRLQIVFTVAKSDDDEYRVAITITDGRPNPVCGEIRFKESQYEIMLKLIVEE